MSGFLGEIRISLSVRPIVPNGAEIFRLVGLDDVEGIKRLFSTGMASPNDSHEDGQTILYVCRISKFMRACEIKWLHLI